MDAYCLRPEELPDLTISRLGEATVDSPLLGTGRQFVENDEKILFYSHTQMVQACEQAGRSVPMLERAGPRRKIFFEPSQLRCGIVTCGGLCPGLNDVIRTVTLSCLWQYGVKEVWGFRYGYAGLAAKPKAEPILLRPEQVDDIHLQGGDILGSSRGPVDPEEMVDTLVRRGIGLLFVVGGDGTLHGVQELVRVIRGRGLQIGVIGIPKTIDNDICGIQQSFGFSTAVEAARGAILAAHAEAKGAANGIGLVKLMGRDSGFIAAYATLANSDVNFCFIPEVPLKLEGPDGFLKALERRLARKGHAVIVVAEGAGQEFTEQGSVRRDASGNIVREDIGLLLKKRIIEHFKRRGITISLKYIDPSYMIRSLPTDSNDAAFCLMLGQNAVHAGMSGRTDMVIGYWNQYFVHVPTALAVLRRKKVDPNGELWQTVLETTGQFQEPIGRRRG